MTMTGCNFVGSKEVGVGVGKSFKGVNAATGEAMEPAFWQASESEIDAAARLAEGAFGVMNSQAGRAAGGPGSPEKKAGFLRAIAEELEAIGGAMSERITLETGLPAARNAGELGRTTGQLRQFAKLVEEGWWVDGRIEHADLERKPAAKPDLRRMLFGIGPVAVFGASNFPQAFSVAGGDTASALAAGCPVVIKAHPAHPGVSEMTFRAMLAAAKKTGMPEGIVSMVQGVDPSVSISLVKHPAICAVGFTGSLRAGRALMDAAASRPVPIPVYAEMGSINPLFILPGAMAERGAKLAEGLKTSVTMGVGQFCTKPGVVVAMEGAGSEAFVGQLEKLLADAPAGVMLTPNIARAFHEGRQRLTQTAGVKRCTPNKQDGGGTAATQGAATLFVTTAERFVSDHVLREELFGPSTVVVLAKDAGQMEKVAGVLEGQLTAGVHAAGDEAKQFAGLVDVLTRKAGRVLFNGFPTGVEVNHAMQHGGPYPATSDGRSTSVGTAAIARFARPVAFQDCPEELLPEELKEGNPRGVRRLVDGKWE